MRIALVNMPWHSLEWPSLALGILHTIAERGGHEVSEYLGNLRWAEYLCEQSGGKLGRAEYRQVSDVGIFLGMGDWIFTPALYETREWKVDEYSAYLRPRGMDPAQAAEMQRLAPEFVERAARDVLALEPDLVGFTTTLMQNVPSLALARQLKRSRPDVATVFGGGNCDGPMGTALHRCFPFVDFVVRGEGEGPFLDLLAALADGRDPVDVPGLCWRSSTGSVSNPDRGAPYPMDQVPSPNYDAYFAAIEQSPLRDAIEPSLVLEAARGCWWGEKQHCTFCGLNGSLMKFRSKTPERVWQEMRTAVARYRTLDILMVDNIMDMAYFKTLLPDIAASDWDLRLHYEVKANLNAQQVQTLKEAGVTHIQPGIESLSSHVLRLMRKGVTGAQNVQLLRDAEEHGLTVSWNYLYGFPGEMADDYGAIIEQMPALVHLQPPRSTSPIALERFSLYFDDPALGYDERTPADFYGYIYDLLSRELEELVYLFDTPRQGILSEVEARLKQAVEDWREAYLASSLTYQCADGRLYVRDRRANREPADYDFDDPVQTEIYLVLRRHTSLLGLQRALQSSDVDVPAERLWGFLKELKRLGLVFEDAGSYVALATRADRSAARVAL